MAARVICFTDEYGAFLFIGAGDDAATEKSGRYRRIGFILFPDSDAVAEFVSVIRSLVYENVTLRAGDERRVHRVADTAHGGDGRRVDRLVAGDCDRVWFVRKFSLGVFDSDFPVGLKNY